MTSSAAVRWSAVVGLSLAVAACDKIKEMTGGGATTQPAAAPAAPHAFAAPVQAVEAVAQDVPVYIDEIGTCAAREFVQVRPQVAGKVTEVLFADGAEVKKGDKLFTIDARPYQAMLDQALAGLAQAKANRELAARQAANAKSALEGRAISREEAETRQNAVIVADAEIKVREAAIETAKINVEYCTITSPIDGRMGKKLVDVGNVVKANDDNAMATIQRMDPIYADFSTSERNLQAVREQSAKGALKTLVSSPQKADTDSRPGELTFLDNTVETGTGTIKLRATVPNQDRQFWPGQFVRVRLVLSEHKGAVMIPARAEQIGQTGPFVYVVKGVTTPDGKPGTIAELRPITPGQRHGEMVVVDKGLAIGEKVVVVGQMMIMPGGPVMVVPSGPPAGAAPTTQATAGH